MKKTNLHFQLAAWSIKNPVAFYGFLITFLVLASLLLMLLFKNIFEIHNQISATSVNVSKASSPKWKLLDEKMYGDRKCLKRQHILNQTVVTSCYTLVQGQWVFEQSF